VDGQNPGEKKMTCPSFERLVDYLDERLEEAQSSEVAAHLAGGCAACTETAGWYQRVRLITASDDTIAPPSWVFKRALNIIEKRRSLPALIERVGQSVASLVFDSFSGPVLAGVRSTETADRQLLYRAGDYSVDLQITPSENSRADLIGQVLQEGASLGSVSRLKLDILSVGQVVASAVTDDMGEFRVSGMKQGVYDLRVELPEGNITVPAVPITES
jgi:hypothetical protein